jgi:hypothetical protein
VSFAPANLPWAALLEGGFVSAAVGFSFVAAPACFRFAPPDAAGRVFRTIARGSSLGCAVLALIATGIRSVDNQWISVCFDLGAAACAAVALAALQAFEHARDAALREPPPGGAVDGAATLRAHALLRGLRALPILGAGLAAAAFLAAGART